MTVASSLGLAAACLAAGTGSAVAAGTVTVHAGQRIQAAIDAAAPGTTIVVKPGTYAENLLIDKDGIQLRGDGGADAVRLVPPVKVAPVCDEHPGAVIGICIANVVGFGPNGPVTKTVHGVHVSGITIENFTDSGIFMFDNSGARIDETRLLNNGGYGVFALSSTGTHLTDSLAVGNDEAGFYVGESPHADAVVRGNDAHGNGFGVFLRDSRGASIQDNVLTGNCVGLVVLNTGAPGGVGAATASDNTISGNSRACPGGEHPPASGIGIAILGADHVTLRDNRVDRNVAHGPTFTTGGIVIAPFPGPGGSPSTFITVTDNSLRGNAPDILVAKPSTTNRFTDNDCATSNPAGLCGD